MRNRTHEFCYEKSVMPCHERLEIEKRRKIIHLGLVMCKGPKNEQNRGAGKSGMPDSQVEDVSNYAEVREKIAAILTSLRDTPNSCFGLHAPPKQVGNAGGHAAMYPNIILTNRLQPPSIVTDEDCAACDFNKPGKTCLRQMEWKKPGLHGEALTAPCGEAVRYHISFLRTLWRGEHYAAGRAEYMAVKNQLQAEAHPPQYEGGPPRYWEDLGQEERAKLLKDRLKLYTHKVGTVRAFRDRRYEYKALNKASLGSDDVAAKTLWEAECVKPPCPMH
eukprot:1159279-Pelagomonas_calceolata.AAC.8